MFSQIGLPLGVFEGLVARNGDGGGGGQLSVSVQRVFTEERAERPLRTGPISLEELMGLSTSNRGAIGISQGQEVVPVPPVALSDDWIDPFLSDNQLLESVNGSGLQWMKSGRRAPPNGYSERQRAYSYRGSSSVTGGRTESSMSGVEFFRKQIVENGRRRPSPRYKSLIYDRYLTQAELAVEMVAGKIVAGRLRIGRQNPDEAYLDTTSDNPNREDSDIIIYGIRDRNRALDGDLVAVRIKERNRWIVQEELYNSYKEGLVIGKEWNCGKSEVPISGPIDHSKQIPPLLSESKRTRKLSDSDFQPFDITKSTKDFSRTPGRRARTRAMSEHSPRLVCDTAQGVFYSEPAGTVEGFRGDELSESPGQDENIYQEVNTDFEKRKYCRGKMIWVLHAKVLGHASAPHWHPHHCPIDDNCKFKLSEDLEKKLDELGLASFAPSEPPTLQPLVNMPMERRRKIDQRQRSQWTWRPVTDAQRKWRSFKTPFDFPGEVIPDWCLQKTGKVVFIEERPSQGTAVGTLKPMREPNRDYALFLPHDNRYPKMAIQSNVLPEGFFYDPEEFGKNLYMGKVQEWTEESSLAIGTLAEFMGKAGELESESAGLLYQFDVDSREFSKKVLDSLPPHGWSIPKEEFATRRDFRREPIYTLQPVEGTLELPVAIHIIKIGENYEVGFHVVDVSYFVKEGTEIDTWANSRATSVNLVQKCVPMLPRELTENLCSFKAGEDRLAISVLLKMTKEGDVISDPLICRSIVNSCFQLTYAQAQRLIDGKSISKSDDFPKDQIRNNIDPAFLQLSVIRLKTIAKGFMKKRLEAGGSLRLDRPKVCFDLDQESGVVTGCAVDSKPEHDVVEYFDELALQMNIIVAQFLYKMNSALCVLRRQAPPNLKLMREMFETCNALGYPMKGYSTTEMSESLRKYGMVEEEEEKRIYAALKHMSSKPMKQSVYVCAGVTQEEKNLGHYSLNVSFYTHFTSPTRRYADIFVQRLLMASIGLDSVSLDPQAVQNLCIHWNRKKQAAKSVSEASVDMFLTQFIKNNASIETDGIVVNVLDHSFDTLLPEYGIVKRIYTNGLRLSKEPHYERKPTPSLTLYWHELTQPRTQNQINPPLPTIQKIHVLSEIKVILSGVAEPTRFNATLKSPADVATVASNQEEPITIEPESAI